MPSYRVRGFLVGALETDLLPITRYALTYTNV
jgi:hypothetical protein